MTSRYRALRLGLGVALAMAVVVGWQLFIPYLYKKMGWAMPGTA